MALPDIDTSYTPDKWYVNSGSVVIKKHFPNMKAVEGTIFPTAKSERVPIDTYAESLRLQGRLSPPVKDSIQKAKAVRESTVAIVYIAGGLTGVDEKTKERYGMVSNFLSTYGQIQPEAGKPKDIFFGYVPHLHGTDPVKHPNVTPNEVRDIDHLWAVVVADVGINFKHPLAHGNAIEAGWQESHLIPEVQQNLNGNRLSRLVLGMNNLVGKQEYIDVFNITDTRDLKLLMDEFSTWIKTFPEKDPREFYYMSTKVLTPPALRIQGYDPNKYNDVLTLNQYLAYVADPQHPRYGRVGELIWHDWSESGMYTVDFGDGVEDFYDGLMEAEKWGDCKLNFWLK